MNEEQRRLAESLLPYATALARRYGAGDDAESVAGMAVCKAVITYRRTSPYTLRSFVRFRVRRVMFVRLRSDERHFAITNFDFSAMVKP